MEYHLPDTSLTDKYDIIPYPQSLIPQPGLFIFNDYTTIFCSFERPDIVKIAKQFSTQFELVSGIKLPIRNISNNKIINAVIFQTNVKFKNTEEYRLVVSSENIQIEANTVNGFFYGLQTLYQLMPVEIYGKLRIHNKIWSASAVEISDSPRFKYRGLLLDVSRHFFPIEFIKKYIDAMAIHKLNIFH
jgi:hexosaminidase